MFNFKKVSKKLTTQHERCNWKGTVQNIILCNFQPNVNIENKANNILLKLITIKLTETFYTYAKTLRSSKIMIKNAHTKLLVRHFEEHSTSFASWELLTFAV